MTASTDFDRLLTSWLETAGPPDVIDDVLTAAFVETRTLPQRRAPWPIGPRSWPAADTTAALPWRTILVAAALVAALAAALALVAGGPPPTPLGLSDSVAIVLRQPDGAVDTVDVVAVGADGAERLVRRFEPGDLGAGRQALPYGEVSLDGWFALALGEENAASGSFALLRLDDPSRPPLFVDYVPVMGGAWSPTGGQFATTTPLVKECCAITVTDATTGDSQDLRDLALPSRGTSKILWARDGSGIVGQVDLTDPSAIWWPTGERSAVGLESAEPSIQRLDGAPAVARSFSADGTAVWGLYDEIRDGTHTAVLARSDGEGRPEVVARVPLGEDVTQLWFAALDRADTRIAIGSWVGDNAVMQPIRIVEPETGRVISVEGNLIGFVPATSLGAPQEASASPDPTPSPAASVPVLDPVPADLVGRWVADVTDGRSFGPSGPKHLTLSIGPERAIVTVSSQPDVLVPSIAGMDPVTGELVLVSESTGERSPLAVDGTPLASCAKGDASAYRVERGASSSVLRLRAIRETCMARSALISTMWSRSLAGESAGGSGVIETVRPPLYLELPAAAYRTEEANGGIAISGDNGVMVSAWEDPFVFEDGCTIDSLPVDPGRSAAELVDALRRTRGLEVVSAEPVELDGISGLGTGVTRVRIRTIPGACGDGREAASVAAWLPRVAVGTPDVPVLVKPGEERVVHVFDYDPADPSEPPRTMVIEVLATDPAVAASVLESVTPIAGLSPLDVSQYGPQ